MIKEKKFVFISQPFGMGDVIFSMGIANYFKKHGYHIHWPVRGQYLESLRRAYPKIHFVDVTSVNQELLMIKEIDKDADGMRIVPIRWSDTVMKVPYKFVMRAKYDMYSLDWTTWKRAARWNRHYGKEKDLIAFLGIQPGEEYNLINQRYGGQHRVVDINVNNGLRNIYMTDVIGFSVFDWASVIERAANLHMVSTSTLYMTEVLELSCKENHLYTRNPVEQNLDYVSYILSKEYILHE